MRSLTTLSIAAMLAAGATTGAMAQTFTATNSLQVNANGPGTSSKYMDVEGQGTGANASGVPYETFGVLDFANLTAPKAGSVFSSVTLSITDSPFSATAPGLVDVYLVSNTAANTGLKYDTTTSNGIGSTQLGNVISLGSFAYTGQSTKITSAPNPATVYTNSFALNTSAQSLLASELNAGTVRFAFGADSSTPTVVGSFAGAGGGGTGTAFPTFSLTPAAPAVPEASTTVSFSLLLAFGFGGMVISRRRKVTAN